MRRLFFASVLALAMACPGGVEAETPATPPAGAADRTIVDHDDVAFELPGRWEERRSAGGYELWRGDQEQVLVTLFPPTEGLDANASAEKLASVQRDAILGLCKHGARMGKVARASAAALSSIQFQFECQEPRVVATFLAGTSQGKVISFEHYRYNVASLTPEILRSAKAIFDTLRIKAPTSSCPPAILSSGTAQGGACLEAAVLGETVVTACSRELVSRHWVRDEVTADLIGKQTGKKLVCYRDPAK
jgi:hypothetical protein